MYILQILFVALLLVPTTLFSLVQVIMQQRKFIMPSEIAKSTLTIFEFEIEKRILLL